MTFDVFGEVLSKVTYKPRWTFKVAHDTHPALIIYRWTEDSRDPGKLMQIRRSVEIPLDELTGRRDATLWIREQIIACETHEVDEFLKFSGKTIFDPHEAENVWAKRCRVFETRYYPHRKPASSAEAPFSLL